MRDPERARDFDPRDGEFRCERKNAPSCAHVTYTCIFNMRTYHRRCTTSSSPGAAISVFSTTMMISTLVFFTYRRTRLKEDGFYFFRVQKGYRLQCYSSRFCANGTRTALYETFKYFFECCRFLLPKHTYHVGMLLTADIVVDST